MLLIRLTAVSLWEKPDVLDLMVVDSLHFRNSNTAINVMAECLCNIGAYEIRHRFIIEGAE
jgi:hypothetical protein